MNKTKCVFFVFIFLFTGLGHLTAQITIESSDMPSEGDMVPVTTGVNVDFVDYTLTGEDFYWDFSGLTPLSQTVDTFMKVNDTPLWYIFFYFSNLAKPASVGIPVPGLPITDIYEYYKKTGSQFKYTGYGSFLYGIPFPILYTSPDIVYRFPMQYGNVDSCTSGVNAGVDNIGYVLVEKFRRNTVDGWGTLTTPYGTFDVLRVKSEISEYDSVYVDSLGTGLPVHRNYTEYKWLAKNGKEPLLTISTTQFGAVATYVDSLQTQPNGVKSIRYDGIKLYPNPSNGTFTVTLNGSFITPVRWELRSLNGSLIQSGTFVEKRHRFHLQNERFSGGTFLLMLSGKNFNVVKKVFIQ